MAYHQKFWTTAVAALAIMLTMGSVATGTEPGKSLIGNDLDAWREPVGEWHLVGDAFLHPDNARTLATVAGQSTLINGSGRTRHLLSKLEHGDVEAHIEFMVPKGSNSGVYFQGRYEIQVLDSWGVENPKHSDCGGIYERWRGDNNTGSGYEGRAPRVNASRKPGEWQTFDVIFRAPRFERNGKKTANAVFVKVVHNGVVVHENQEVTGPTRASAFNDEQPGGPLMLQGDHGLVAYRNIRIRPLEDERPKEPVSALFTSELFSYESGKSLEPMAAIEKRIQDASPAELAELEAGLVQILQRKDATQACKQFACRMLRRMGTKKSVPILAELLMDEELSHMARFALGGMPGSGVDKVLRKALGTTSGDLQLGVISCIADRGDRKAVSRLAKLVGSDDAALAEAAISALGRIGGSRAARVLANAKVGDDLEILRDDAYLVCADALLAEGESLSKVAAMYRELSEESHSTIVRIGAYRGLVETEGERALPTVLALLKDKDTVLRQGAGRFVTTMPGTATAFAAELPYLAPGTQVVVLSGLAARGDKSVAPAVAWAVKSEEPTVQIAALQALGHLGGARNVQLLAEMACADSDVGAAAIDSLCLLSGPGVGAALLEVFEDGDPVLRAKILHVLERRGDSSAVPAALEAAGDADAGVREAAVKLVEKFGREAELPGLVDMLLAGKNAADRRLLTQAVASVAGRMKDGDARSRPIVAGLAKANDKTKVSLLSILGGLGGEEALDATRAELERGSPDIKKAAVRTMADWPDSSPIDDLADIAKHDPDETCRLLALRGFIRMIDSPEVIRTGTAVQKYEEAMELARDVRDKKLVLVGASGLVDTRALPFVKKYFGDAALEADAKAAYEKIARATNSWNEDELDQDPQEPPRSEYVLTAEASNIVGIGAKRKTDEDGVYVGSWEHVSTWLMWTVNIETPGSFSVEVSQANSGSAGSEYVIAIEDKQVAGVVEDTGGWGIFKTTKLGEIEVHEPGLYTVGYMPTQKAGDRITRLKSVTLERVE